jgi:hypothetical protein
MSSGFNFIQLTAPQNTEWTRQAKAAYGRSPTSRSAADTFKPSREPRWYDRRNVQGKVWRRASSPGVRI